MFKNSLVYVVTKGSIVLVICAFIASFSINQWYVFNLTTRSHLDQLTDHLTLLSSNLEAPLWTLDSTTIKLIADAYMAGNNVARLKIVSKDYKEPLFFSEKSSKDISSGKKEIIHNNVVIGFVEVGLSKESYVETLKVHAFFGVLLITFTIIFLVFFMRRLIKKHLEKPLITMSVWTDSLASGEYNIPTPRINFYELSPLANKFSEMAQKIELREKELINYRNNLQALVDEQTIELKEAHFDLLQKERLATLGQLTATVSHELRNPLGTIRTSLFFIEDSIEKNCSQKVSRSINLADRSINRCVKIIEELNDHARAKKLHYSNVYFDGWIKSVINEIDIPDWIEVEFHLNCDSVVFLDQERIRQVIINLVNNAIDSFHSESSSKAVVQIFTLLQGEKYEIRFRDTGCGFSDDIKEKIFKPLFSTKGFGVGLGMVIVKDIIEQHRGEINVESKEGEGTTITLCLPVNLTD